VSALPGWMAMRVVRKHTLPHHRREILAEHTWGVIHILMCIYPNAPLDLVRKVMYHDIGEYRSGDMPGDFKAAHPEVRDMTEEFEMNAAKEVLPPHLHDTLFMTTEEAFLVKICDRIEFAFSCYHEWMMGNRYSAEPMRRTIDMAREYIRINEASYTGLPESLQTAIADLLNESDRLWAEVNRAINGTAEIKYASE
jgi:5'-deoxynucleotidase YfbR-like HD superfamily hydrolase